jgi:hypothetical protein
MSASTAFKQPCPKCGAMLMLDESLIDKMVACGSCQFQFVAEPPSRTRPMAAKVPGVQEDEDGITSQSPNRVGKKKPPPLKSYDEDEQDRDEDDDEIETRSFIPDTGTPDFFRPAPPEIGKLITRHTSLTEEVQPQPIAVRLMYGGLITGGIMFLLLIGAVVVNLIARQPIPLFVTVLILFGLGVIVAGLTLWWVFDSSYFTHYCAYVGQDGVAQYACMGDRDRSTKEEMLLFEYGADLRVSTTHHYMNGAYTGTHFNYTWTNRDNEKLFEITGMHGAENDMPPEANIFYFALESERIWSIHLLDKVLAKLKEGKTQKFRLSGENYILLRSDSLQLNLNGRQQEFSRRDLAEMRIQNGEITLKEPHSHEGWFTSTGVHQFAFAELSNARVFLLLMQSIFNIPIT